MAIRDEFKVHILNDRGIEKATHLAESFSQFLTFMEENLCGGEGREMAIVRTKLQEASFYAKRALAQRPEYQKPPA